MTGGANDTIAAVSTPPGEGAIALVRLSGSKAIAVADQVFAAARSRLKCSRTTKPSEKFSTAIS